MTRPAGFEPARGNPNGFQVHRLNHSAIVAYKAQPAGVEPARGNPNGLAGHRLNHSAMVADIK